MYRLNLCKVPNMLNTLFHAETQKTSTVKWPSAFSVITSPQGKVAVT